MEGYIVACRVSSNDCKVYDRHSLSVQSACSGDLSADWVHPEVRAANIA